MTRGQLVELICLLVTLCAIAEFAFCRIKIVDLAVELTKTQGQLDTALARAETAEAIIRTAAGAPPAPRRTGPRDPFERHADQALEAAEPTPDLRRVR